MGLVEKVAEDFRANGVSVKWLHEMGEPLLYPRLAEAIDLFPGCSVSTNTMLLDGEIGRRCSQHAGSDPAVRRHRQPRGLPLLRRGGIFEQVVATSGLPRALARAPDQGRDPETDHPPDLPGDGGGLPQFFELDRYPQAEVIEKTCEGLDTSDETDLHQSYYGCFQGYPFRWFIVMSDGRVTHCCYDAHGQQPIGDIKTQTVREIVDS